MVIFEFLGITVERLANNNYVQAVFILVIFFAVAKFLTFLVEKYVLKWTAKTKTDVDDQIIAKTHGPISLLLFLIGVKLAIIPLKLAEEIETILARIDSTLSVLVVMYAVMVVLDVIISAWVKNRAKKKETEIDENLMKLGSKTARVVLLILALLFILRIWQIQIGPLLASLGIIGIAVAFGLQTTLGNIFGGISLILDRSIKVGDIIKIDEETYGQVADVGIRATKIRTWDNELIIIPNGKLAGQNIKNYVLPNPTARITVPFSVAYGSEVEKVKRIVMKEVKKLNNLDKNHEPMVMFLEMGASSLNFKAFVWLKSYKERFTTKERLNCMIYNALNKNKITIPFPQMDVWIKQHKK